MAGNTADLTDCKFVDEAHELLRFLDKEILREDVIRSIGVKRTNANDMASIGVNGGVALYPTYPLMNSHCHCNTRYYL